MIARILGALVADPAPPSDYGEIDALFPAHIQGWALISRASDGAAYQRADGLKVIASIAEEEDGKQWLHVSCSRRARLPTYGDMVDVKAIFVGEHREAYQVFARASKHVNLMPFCLHLWCRLDGPALPDFTRGGSTI